jgi:DNA-binding MarR family transcriptional regulator
LNLPEGGEYSLSEDWTDDVVRVSDLFVQIMYKTLSQRLIAELTDAKVSLPQIQALRYIWLHQNVLIGDLAEGLDISYPSATNMVNRLERQALVERVVNPADRREVQVQLTQRGTELTEQMETERINRLREVMEEMSPEERRSLLEGLRRFVTLAVGDDRDMAHDVCLRCGARASATCPIAEIHAMHICQ